jgi:hypothetical protein
MSMSADEIEQRVMAAEQRAAKAETKADKAAEVAVSSLETQKHLVNALEKSHAQMSEMLAAVKQMSGLASSLAHHVLDKNKESA